MSRRKKIALIATGILLIIAVAAAFNWGWIEQQFFGKSDSSVKSGITSDGQNEATKIVAQDLTVPWGLAFLPSGDVLVTERSGTLQRVNDGKEFAIPGVQHTGEGGLMGIALHPDFSANKWLYLYLTTESGDGLTNRLERYRFDNDRLRDKKVIIENIPGASNHDGGRIAFGPDGKLYVTTGDAGVEDAAQDKTTLAGKILRLNDDGSIPADNPFGSAVYSYGHRNPQGIAWDDKGQLWSSEHGRSGAMSGYDEINLIKKGANYGWPVIEGGESRAGMEKPAVHSGADDTWAPAGLAYLDGSLFFGGLRGETLYEAKIHGNDRLAIKAHFKGEYGRLRTTAVDPAGQMLVTTSNTDGRGETKPSDDKIIRLNPRIFH